MSEVLLVFFLSLPFPLLLVLARPLDLALVSFSSSLPFLEAEIDNLLLSLLSLARLASLFVSPSTSCQFRECFFFVSLSVFFYSTTLFVFSLQLARWAATLKFDTKLYINTKRQHKNSY